MPSKKGSKIAASQARAKSAAKKKAHSTGPDLAAAARETEVTDALSEEGVTAVAATVADGNDAGEAHPASSPAPRRTGRTASRRERQALTVMSAGSLRREVAIIGSVTALMGITLALVKLVTDLGR